MTRKEKTDDISSYDYNTLIFFVNGKRIEENKVDPKTPLAVYLRDYLHLTGTKIGCNEGGCGACTVMISEISLRDNQIRHYSANACLMPICGVFGKAVTTVEGLGSVVSKRLHPVQERLAMTHGTQCGFCSPGFVMAMYALLRNSPSPTKAEINEALQGNLCRCTGYRPILEAFYSFSVKSDGQIKVSEDNGCPMGEQCCKVKKATVCKKEEAETSQESNGVINGVIEETGAGARSDKAYRQEKLKLTDLSQSAAYDPSQELIFPPEIKVKSLHHSSFAYAHDETMWFQPNKYSDLLELKRLHPDARIIAGNSEVAVELKFQFIKMKTAINPRQVPELHEVRLNRNGAYVGSGLSLTEMNDYLTRFIAELP
ncbi:2Fe-2S iron-sulfur cluster-binding domain protein, partial [Oesophagostomum dentatum]